MTHFDEEVSNCLGQSSFYEVHHKNGKVMISSKLCSFRIEKGGEMGAGHHAPLHYKIENYSFHSNNGEIGNNFLAKVNFTSKCIPCFAAETLLGVILV